MRLESGVTGALMSTVHERYKRQHRNTISVKQTQHTVYAYVTGSNTGLNRKNYKKTDRKQIS